MNVQYNESFHRMAHTVRIEATKPWGGLCGCRWPSLSPVDAQGVCKL